MQRLLAVFLFCLACVGINDGASARPGHGGSAIAISNPNCPKGLTYALYDGCTDAQPYGSSGTDANLLTSFNGGSAYLTPPPFNVPARDYPVGYDTRLTLTPAASWTPPADTGCTTDTAAHKVTCHTQNSTCGSNCVISGVDFTDWWILLDGTAPSGNYWKITNNKFKFGTTVAFKDRQLVTVASGTRISLDYLYNECDGNSAVAGWGSCLGSVNGGIDASHLVTWNVNYNYVHDIPSNPFVINGSYANVSMSWNYFPSFDMDQWTAQNVSIDSVANTITIAGPFVTTGTNLVHGADPAGTPSSAQGTFTRYSSLPVNSAGTSVTGTIGSQISGTPGGLGVYNFTGATGDLTNATIDGGRGLHGEINLSGIDNGTLQNLMYYRGNLVVYADDCPANGTANIALIVQPNKYVGVHDAHLDYNTLINRVSGNGKGCSAHALANNGVVWFDSVDISNNYLDPTNTLGFNSPSSTSCFFWPGAFSFVGSQSGSTLTVTSTSNGGPIPLGTTVMNGSTSYGMVTGQISVNPDGSGTYQMSDSRTQSFSSGNTSNAPNLANAGGAIPYAPFFTGNKNMLLSGSAADFVISDARMTTTAACHT